MISIRHLIGLFFIYAIAFGQGFDHNWHFGSHASIEFTPLGPLVNNLSALDTKEASSAISDPVTGRLLFYTDGITVYDSTHQPMPNGDSLAGHISSTHCFILPWPERPQHYFIFTTEAAEPYFWGGAGRGLRWTLVDMSQNQGKGDVVLKNQLLLDPVGERMAIARHANGVDAWLITHKWNSGDFYAYRITCAGIDSLPVISTVGPAQTGQGITALDMTGFMKVSLDGQHLALSRKFRGQIEVYDFDPGSGAVSHPLVLPNIPQPFGIEFSPSARYLYLTWFHQSGSYLGQLDLWAGNPAAIQASCDTLASNFGQVGMLTALQIGPDRRIYLARSGKNYLSVISQPDLPGPQAQYLSQGLSLGNATCQSGLPNACHLWPDPDRDTALVTVRGECVSEPIHLENQTEYQPDSTHWILSDQTGATARFSRQAQPEMDLVHPGLYALTRIDYRGCRRDTQQVNFQVFGLLADLGPDRDLCEGDTLCLNAGPQGYLYQWSNGDLGAHTDILQSGQYVLSISEGSCLDTDTLNVDVRSPFALDLGGDRVICEEEVLALEAPIGNYTWLWSDGSTERIVKIAQAGEFWLKASDGVCEVGDTVRVDRISPPRASFPPELMLCSGEKLLLQADPENKHPQATFTWSTGESGADLEVEEPGDFAVDIRIGECVHRSQVAVLPATAIPPTAGAGPMILCQGQVIHLSVDTTLAHRIWPDGSMGSQYEISEPGTWVLQSFNKCEERLDTFEVGLGEAPQIAFPTEVWLCEGESTRLEPEVIAGGPHLSYRWSNGADTESIEVRESGVYRLEVSNDCGSAEAELRVHVLPGAGPEVPNVFTPNGDGINELFRVKSAPKEGFLFRVQDRWGHLLFQTNNPEDGWDGTLRGQPLVPGTYFYSVQYRDCRGKLSEISGSFSLLR